MHRLKKYDEAIKCLDVKSEEKNRSLLESSLKERIKTWCSIQHRTLEEELESLRQRLVKEIKAGIKEHIDYHKKRAELYKGNELAHDYVLSSLCSIGGLKDEALELAEAMLEFAARAYKRNMCGYGYACAAFVKAGRAERAWSIINESSHAKDVLLSVMVTAFTYFDETVDLN